MKFATTPPIIRRELVFLIHMLYTGIQTHSTALFSGTVYGLFGFYRCKNGMECGGGVVVWIPTPSPLPIFFSFIILLSQYR